MRWNSSKILTGVLYVILGIICILYKSDILVFTSIFVGVVLIAFGILELITGFIPGGIALCVTGVIIIALSRVLINAVVYVIAVAAIVIGIVLFARFLKNRAVNDSILSPGGLRPFMIEACGVILLLNAKRAIDVLFVVIGILLIASGVCSMAEIKK